MTLSPDIIETMLQQLKENQEELKKDYNSRIDKLEIKIESMFDKIERKYDEYVTKTEFKYQEEKIKTLEEQKKAYEECTKKNPPIFSRWFWYYDPCATA